MVVTLFPLASPTRSAILAWQFVHLHCAASPAPRLLIDAMSAISSLPFTVGKFHITPLSRAQAAGRFVASLSIRRGRGAQTHDRIYTFKPEFSSQDSALMYAAAQGRYWLINPASLA